jgi:mRNA deadenylase 3'-5' endonuclease subunit Ccr4
MFNMCNKDDINEKTRRKRTAKLITQWMKEGKIIALQELCDWWEPFFNVHFNNNNYHLISKQYSHGKLGIGIAYPRDIYELLIINVFTPGDSYNRMLIDGLPMNKIIKTSRTDNFTTAITHLYEGSRLDNKCISIKLRIRDNPTKEFWVSTYHMPCKYDKLVIMHSHIVSIMCHLNHLCEKLPIIFMGDLNIVPKSTSYDLLLNHIVSEDILKLFKYSGNRMHPFKSADETFNIADKLIKFASAWKDVNGIEPNYTNVCITKEKKFIDTLDYVLYRGLIPIQCKFDNRITDYPEACNQIPHPTSRCASDHLPIIGKFVYPS